LGIKIIAVSDIHTALYNPSGIDIPELIAYSKLNNNSIDGFRHAVVVDNDYLLTLKVDVLIPAAKEDVITAENASRINAKIIVEGANGLLRLMRTNP